MFKIGMHQQFRGLAESVMDAVELGNNTFQIFTRNNRNMKQRVFLQGDYDAFNWYLEESNITDFVVHAPYVMNPASGDEDLIHRSKELIKGDMYVLNKLEGKVHYVLHPGSYTEYTADECVTNLLQTLEDLQGDYGKVRIAVENMAGQGTQLMSSIDQMGWMLQVCQKIPNFEMCIDTCHAFAAGVPMSQLIAMFNIFGCNDRIGVIHVNDSCATFGSRVDRHANIGRGQMGYDRIKSDLLELTKVAPDAPIILETPVEFQEDDVRLVKEMLA